MRRGVLIGFAVALALLLAPALASASTVKVIDTNGKEFTADLATLQGQEDAGTGDKPGFSVTKVLQAAGADSISYVFLSVSQPGKGVVSLTKDQVRATDGAPFFYTRGGGVGFDWVNATAGANYDFSDADELVVTLSDDSPIGITLGANKEKIEAGESVFFNATVTSPENLTPTLSWNFGDGARFDDANSVLSHKFNKAGTYVVAVSAKDPDTGIGPTDTVQIQVGEEKEGGPNQQGGGKDDGNSESGTNEDTGGSDSGTDDSTNAPTAPVTPTAPVAPAAPVEVPPVEQPDKPDKPDPAPVTGEQVSGELLEDPGVSAQVVEEKPKETKASTLREGTEADGFGVSGAAMGGMAVFALLGIGALGQAGKLRVDSLLWHMNRMAGR